MKFYTFVFLCRQVTLCCSILVCFLGDWHLRKDRILTPAEQILQTQISAYLTGWTYVYITYSCSSRCRVYVCLPVLPLTTWRGLACSQNIFYDSVHPQKDWWYYNLVFVESLLKISSLDKISMQKHGFRWSFVLTDFCTKWVVLETARKGKERPVKYGEDPCQFCHLTLDGCDLVWFNWTAIYSGSFLGSLRRELAKNQCCKIWSYVDNDYRHIHGFQHPVFLIRILHSICPSLLLLEDNSQSFFW